MTEPRHLRRDDRRASAAIVTSSALHRPRHLRHRTTSGRPVVAVAALVLIVAAVALVRSSTTAGSAASATGSVGLSTAADSSVASAEDAVPGPRATTTTTTPVEMAEPVRVEIPAIDVTAPVIPLGLEPDGSLEVPEDFDETGWYEPGPEPGETGPAVIAGHVDSYTGPAVFFRLDDLDRGDEVLVRHADGATSRFEVTDGQEYRKDRFPTERVYGDTDEAALRLITCGGDFDPRTKAYVSNYVVYATAVT